MQYKSIMVIKGRNLIKTLHLWIGLVSGIVIFLVSVTGCLYVFKNEITRLIHPWSRIQVPIGSFMEPSALLEKAKQYMRNAPTSMEVYPDYPVVITCNKGEYRQSVYLHPISGVHLYTVGKDGHFDFFGFILNGHRYLWLPPKIGKTIVGVAIISYFFLLITGIILWWPRRLKKYLLHQRLSIKLHSNWKRTNYDLHNVLGFYAFIFLLIFVISGLSFAYPWLSQGIYKSLSLGKAMPLQEALTPNTKSGEFNYANIDVLVRNIHHELTRGKSGYYIRFPKNGKGALLFGINDRPGTFYRLRMKAYDNDFRKVVYSGRYSGTYETASAADRALRLNYDIHVGSWGGIKTKILAFLASLVSASLPITGVLIYYGRKKRKKSGA